MGLWLLYAVPIGMYVLWPQRPRQRHTRRGIVAASIVGLVLVASACGSDSGAGKGGVQVTLKDFQIDLSTTTVPAGEVTFDVSNEGPTTHELEIFSVPDGVDVTELPVRSNVADTESEGLKVIDEVEDIVPATTASLTVSLEPGSRSSSDHARAGNEGRFIPQRADATRWQPTSSRRQGFALGPSRDGREPIARRPHVLETD